MSDEELIEMIKAVKINKNLKKKGVVYTCMTGNYDNIINHHYIDDNWHYTCFTDCPPENPQNYIWEFLPLSFDELDNVRNQRWHKLHPHLLFPEYENSLYVDTNLDLLTCDIFNDVENQISQGQLIAIPPHFLRNNIFDEFDACLQCAKDSAEVIKKQEKLLKELGFSGDYMNGRFFESNIIYRHHHNKIVVAIMNDWWWWIKHYSYRDQLSLTYVLWKHNLSVPFLTETTYREGNRVKYNVGENHITPFEKIAALRNEIAALRNEIVTMGGVIEDKDRIINSLLGSRSWRITWILRKLDNALRNMRQWLCSL